MLALVTIPASSYSQTKIIVVGKYCIQANRALQFRCKIWKFTLKKIDRDLRCRWIPKNVLKHQIEIDNNPCLLVHVSFPYANLY